jgi:hypothetical protein
MRALPGSMLEDTFQYVLNFTISHEGPTNFMYKSWSAKNPNPDVTIGVGHALTSLPKIEIGPPGLLRQQILVSRLPGCQRSQRVTRFAAAGEFHGFAAAVAWSRWTGDSPKKREGLPVSSDTGPRNVVNGALLLR